MYITSRPNLEKRDYRRRRRSLVLWNRFNGVEDPGVNGGDIYSPRVWIYV